MMYYYFLTYNEDSKSDFKFLENNKKKLLKFDNKKQAKTFYNSNKIKLKKLIMLSSKVESKL